jgi:glutaredoxin-related protein
MTIYGSMLCPDCVECVKDLDAAGTAYIFCDFSDNLLNLKNFLKIRDQNDVFEEVKREGKIGIPCIVYDDGTVSLTWK